MGQAQNSSPITLFAVLSNYPRGARFHGAPHGSDGNLSPGRVSVTLAGLIGLAALTVDSLS